jgi:lysophospholipase L1-like esterase
MLKIYSPRGTVRVGRVFAWWLPVTALCSCTSEEPSPTESTGGSVATTGGVSATGGNTTSGGTASGGTVATGGQPLTTGGVSSGGSPTATGGTSTGGSLASGGTLTGGAPAAGTGGTTGGQPVGGSGGTSGATGGKASGGASTGGAATGGATGGAATGGMANGGMVGTVPLDPSLMSKCRTGTAQECNTTSNKPCVLCTLDVANGNHNVTVEVGSATAAGASRVESELYRISAPETATASGAYSLLSFTVNVRAEKHDGYTAPGGKLDLIVDGAAPQLHGLGVAAAPSAITIFVAGDSTVCDWAPTATNASSTNQRGWAQELSQYFKPGVAVANYADSGETAGGFYSKFWGDAKPLIKMGDYVFIQFGHNDQKNQADIDNYKTNLMKYVTDAKNAKATPVLFTPVNRKNTSPAFAGLDQQARDLAAAQGVALIDLTNLSVAYYKTQSNLTPLFADGDSTHLSEAGATAISGLVANAIKTGTLPLKDYVR